MGLTKFEKLSYVGGPWFFGIVLILCGLYMSKISADKFHALLIICIGLICMALYCVCGLLAKIVESR